MMNEENKRKRAASKNWTRRSIARRQKMVLGGDGGLKTSTPLELPHPPSGALVGWEEAAAHLHETFDLTPQEQKFVLHYIETGKKGESAKAAGYKCAAQSAQDLVNRSRVKAAIDYAQRALSTRLFAKAEQVNGALAAIGYADHYPVKDAIHKGGGVEEILKRLRALEPWQLACIKSLSISGAQQTLTITYTSATDALKTLSQNLGLSRGREDKDMVSLIFEEVREETETVEETAAGMVALGPGLEADFSESEEEQPRNTGANP